jgi:hypothetical protein
MGGRSTQVFADGLDRREGPRWHDGRLRVSDLWPHRAGQGLGRIEAVDVDVPGAGRP